MGNDHDKFVEFKAEIRADLKYLRVDTNKMQEAVVDLTKKINSQCTEIAILKTKVALYAAGIGAVVSLVIAIVSALMKG